MPAEFLERVQPFLVTREAEHCLILGLLDGLRAGEQFGSAPPIMASVEERGEVKAVVLMTPPHNLIVSWVADDSTIGSIADELHSKGVAIPGVNGSADIARKFALKWCELSGRTFRVQMAQRIYQLSRVTKQMRAAGRLREPTQSDDAVIRKWRAAFSIDAEYMDAEEAARQAALPMPKSRHLMLWEVEGAAVSMAGYSGRTPNGIRVAWVYTPPENRGKGFAAHASRHSARSCSMTAASSVFYTPTSPTRSPITSIRRSGMSRSPTPPSILSRKKVRA